MVLLVVDQAHNGGHDILYGCLQLGMAPRPHCTNQHCVVSAPGDCLFRDIMAQVALSQPAYTGSLQCEGSPSEMLKELCWLMLGSTMEMLMHLKATG